MCLKIAPLDLQLYLQGAKELNIEKNYIRTCTYTGVQYTSLSNANTLN